MIIFRSITYLLAHKDVVTHFYAFCLSCKLIFLLSGLSFFEASAKENINVKAVFERLVDIICDKMSESLDSDPTMTQAGKGGTARLTDKSGGGGAGGAGTQSCNC